MSNQFRLSTSPFEDLSKSLVEALKNVKNIIMVLSGKGGVGKSFVSASIAISLKLMGRGVAILDADFHGPSIPWILGVENRYPSLTLDGKIAPVDVDGISVISIEFMLDNKVYPVIWRGPMKSKAILELLMNTAWGSKDYLVVDLPPGTGDEPLTIAQYLRVKPLSAILVLTPGSMVKHIVEKARQFLNLLNIPLLGYIVNMSYLRCPRCNEVVKVFGSIDVDPKDVLAEIPLDPELSQAIENGVLANFIKSSDSESAKILRSLGVLIESKLRNTNSLD